MLGQHHGIVEIDDLCPIRKLDRGNRKRKPAPEEKLGDEPLAPERRELLDDEQRRVERVLLEIRLAEGLPVEVLTATERRRLDDLEARGLATDAHAGPDGRVVLTQAGRLLADGVVRDLLD